MKSSAASAPAKEPGQVTFSAIGDVHVAVNDAIHRNAVARPRTGWAGIAICALLAYLAGVAALLSLDASPRLPGLLQAPLAPALVCLIVAWSRARWKRRARTGRAELKVTRRTMESLAHETAAGLDAVQAHSIALRATIPQCENSAHFALMCRGAGRIANALDHAQSR